MRDRSKKKTRLRNSSTRLLRTTCPWVFNLSQLRLLKLLRIATWNNLRNSSAAWRLWIAHGVYMSYYYVFLLCVGVGLVLAE